MNRAPRAYPTGERNATPRTANWRPARLACVRNRHSGPNEHLCFLASPFVPFASLLFPHHVGTIFPTGLEKGVWQAAALFGLAGARLELPQRAGRTFIRGIDRLLRPKFGLFEYTDDPRCIIRIARSRSPRTVHLPDGTLVPAGAPVLELHFWNEHLPRIPPGGPDLAWARTFRERIQFSLEALADYLARHPELGDVVALRGETSLSLDDNLYAAFLRRLGFTLIPLPPPSAWWKRLVRFFEHLYVWMLIWTYNPESLRGKSLRRARRVELWMSAAELLARYRPKER